MSHTSGTGVHFEDFEPLVFANNVTECIHKFKNKPLAFLSGSSYSYSNYGYQLLGAVIEAVTQKPYNVVLDEFVHKLGLNSTIVETMESPLILDRARYYRPLNKTAFRVNVPSPVFDELFAAEAMWSDGNVQSNIPELLAYGQLLIDASRGMPDAILSHKTSKLMWMPHTGGVVDFDKKTPVNYGYGWRIWSESFPEKLPFNITHPRYVSHSGGAMGLITWMNVYPEEEIVAVVLTNKGWVGGQNELLAYAVETLGHFLV